MTHNESPQHEETNIAREKELPARKESFFKELLRFSLIAIVVVLPIRYFIAQPFIVNGASMDPTFETGQYLIVDQLSYRFENPSRGDVVIFRYPLDPQKFFIKRVIGLPGETVILNASGITIINEANPDGFALDQDFVQHTKTENLSEITLRETEYFVLGDNRPASSDSRSWGPLPRKNIVGRAFLRLLPVTEVGVLPGSHSFESNELSPEKTL
ncbi:MAG: signal peptidase I [Candidatus Paceibacterota bacterium]